jgi:hypothetical protein
MLPGIFKDLLGFHSFPGTLAANFWVDFLVSTHSDLGLLTEILGLATFSTHFLGQSLGQFRPIDSGLFSWDQIFAAMFHW